MFIKKFYWNISKRRRFSKDCLKTFRNEIKYCFGSNTSNWQKIIFKNDILIDDNYFFVYTLTNSTKLKRYITELIKVTHYKIYLITITVRNQIVKLIYGAYKAKAAITDSFHGKIFSIIIYKPFVPFVLKGLGNERFNLLKEAFGIGIRIFDSNSTPNFKLLRIKLNINKILLKSLKKQSINFLRKNLNYYKKI